MNNLSFEITFHNTAESLVIIDKTGAIIHMNPSVTAMFGYEKDELEGKSIEELMPLNYRSNHVHLRNSYIKNPHSRPMGKGKPLFGRRKDGHVFPVEVSLSPVIYDEKEFYLAFIMDVTEKREAARKLEELNANLEKEVEKRTQVLKETIRELEKTKKELSEALMKEKKLNDLKSRFVSMASHEFRTPIATVMSSLELAKKYMEQGDTERQKKHFERIHISLKGLTAILDDVLSLGKLEEGKITLTPEYFNFKGFVEDLVSEMQLLSKTGQNIHLLQNGEENHVFLDKNCIRLIVTNLISNAIKFSPEYSEIRVEFSISENSLFIIVADNGIGIPEEDQKNLFKSFYRGHNVANIQGTGLGLNIVNRYLQLMQGTIHFKSSADSGTEFTIKILLNSPDAAPEST